MNFSIASRLFLSTAIALTLFLGATGLLLDSAFSISLEKVEREKLQSQIYLLLSIANNENGTIELPTHLSEPRFNTPGESLLAIVTDAQGKESWRSLSAADRNFSLPAPQEGEWLFGRAEDVTGDSYYVSSFSTRWPDSSGDKTTFVFTVMEGADYYRSELMDYRMALTGGLLVFGLTLFGLQALILRWGLTPLRGVTLDVDAMNKGELQSFRGSYPKELKPLTENLNLLVANERRQRKRYRDRMADLSHSLKTPLSVLRGIESDIDESGQPISRAELVQTLSRQVGRMSNIVDYQLQRAVSGGEFTSFVATNVADQVESIVSALNKVYFEKGISVEVGVDPQLSFYGDENDLTELLGNLADNAYKHCQKKVCITAVKDMDETGGMQLLIIVEDDGPGVPDTQRERILRRGVRLDSNLEGQGFGLAIVVEIVDSYKGSLTIADSASGGAMFVVKLPTK
ncbi:MAG: ATP-binding protein [Halioglobus sp.]